MKITPKEFRAIGRHIGAIQGFIGRHMDTRKHLGQHLDPAQEYPELTKALKETQELESLIEDLEWRILEEEKSDQS